jgi:hypothetical protein
MVLDIMYAFLLSMSDAILNIPQLKGNKGQESTLERKTFYQDLESHSQSSRILRNPIIRAAAGLLLASDLRDGDSV